MGVLDRFLNAIRLDSEDEFDEDDFDERYPGDESGFLDDDQEPDSRRKILDRFTSKKSEKMSDPDDLENERQEKRSGQGSSLNQGLSRASSGHEKDSTVRQTRSQMTSSKITPIRGRRSSSNPQNIEVCVIRPNSMEDTRGIADTLVDGSTVILNLEGIDVELAQRIIDFTSGACYSLGGTLQKVSSYIFVLGPQHVDITGDLQNIMGGSGNLQNVRAGY